MVHEPYFLDYAGQVFLKGLTFNYNCIHILQRILKK